MEFIPLVEFVKYGTAPLLLVMIVLMVVILVGQKKQGEDIREIKDGIIWGDTCVTKHEALNKRVDGIEHRVELLEIEGRKA